MSGGAPRALVTGVTGQDGSFLAEQLLDRGYRVTGISRRSPADGLGWAEHLRDRVEVVVADLLDGATIKAAIEQASPQEIYHLGAPTFVPESWKRPDKTFSAIVGSTIAVLEAVRSSLPSARVFVASSAEIYGDTDESPQNEETACRPRSPYGTAKLAAHQMVGHFRRRDGLFACSGILYNHESERRGPTFVTRKITRGAAAIKLGLTDELVLGDLDAVRDWSFAGDVVRAGWMMLQDDAPADYVVASGVGRTVRTFLDAAFKVVELDPDRYVRFDPSLARGTERVTSVGDPSRIRTALSWEPEVGFDELVERMVVADLDDLGRRGE